MVKLAVHNLVEAFDGIVNVHQHTFQTRKLLGHEEGLRQETLHTAGARHDQLVFIGKFFHPENCDDVLQFLVALQHAFHALGAVVMRIAEGFSVQDAGVGVEGIHGGVNSLLGHFPA